jgi:hypothetical protein
MLIVHTLGDGIGVPRDRFDDETNDWVRFWAYRIGSPRHQILLAALERIREAVINTPGVISQCNARFITISQNRPQGPIDFSTLFSDGQHPVILCYCPETRYLGATSAVGGRFITICRLSFVPTPTISAEDRVAATIIHELAHVAGATGATTGPGHHIAESAVRVCGFPQAFQRGGGG